ncbi:MAG: conjugal transfer protein TraG N-terminal domain-containing protein [Gammaproteobacteria bacterium]|nr:conjugal transfer protein TraG N-terminal domain-containing protein [Gammaproteobacteria bacterium]
MNAIGVDSYVELYTTILGWHQYNVLWEVLTQTGLVFLPFLGILIRHFVEPVKSQQPRSASITSLHRIELDLFTMLTVIVLAGQPILSLDVAELNFIKLCRWSDDAKFTTQNIPFNQALSPFKKVGVSQSGVERTRVPIWWYGVMSFSSGFTLAAKTSLPCMSDVRMMRSVMLSSSIQDPMLIANIQRFQQECHTPAYTFATIGRGESSDWASADEQELQALIKQYGERDMLQLGSRIFLEFRGPGKKYFYQGRNAVSDVGGFEEGNPSCYDWWFGHDGKVLNALYSQLKMEVRLTSIPGAKEGETVSLYENARRFLSTVVDKPTEDEVYNYAIALFVMPSSLESGPLFYSQNDFMKGGSGGRGAFAKEWNTLSGFWGILWESFKQFPLAHITQEAAYVVQPLLLMGLYLILPIGLVFSGFSFKFLIMGAAGIFALKFMTYLFHVTSWMDQHLLFALSAGNTLQGHDNGWVLGGLGLGSSIESLKIELLIVGLYFFFPVLLLALMGWAGLNIGTGLQQVYDRVGGTGSPLASAGSAAIGAVRAGMRGAGKAVKSFRR